MFALHKFQNGLRHKLAGQKGSKCQFDVSVASVEGLPSGFNHCSVLFERSSRSTVSKLQLVCDKGAPL